LRSEAKKFPFAADALNQKLKEVERDLPLIKGREQYEGLILTFERVLDECEAELASHGKARIVNFSLYTFYYCWEENVELTCDFQFHRGSNLVASLTKHYHRGHSFEYSPLPSLAHGLRETDVGTDSTIRGKILFPNTQS